MQGRRSREEIVADIKESDAAMEALAFKVATDEVAQNGVNNDAAVTEEIAKNKKLLEELSE